MTNIDLHIHSLYSDDGELSIREILELCKKSQVGYMAITDHNSVRGVAEAIELGAELGIQVVAGVELDCVHMGRNFHLLGYNFDYTNPAFAEIEQSILAQERTAAVRKIALIKQATGLPLSEDEVLTAAGDGAVTGELIAEILLKSENAEDHAVLQPYLTGGARDDNPYVNFYWDYFSQGKPAYLPIQYISLEAAVKLLHDVGGIAVLAHPAQNLRGDLDFISQLIATGIDGVEAYSSYHGRTEASYFEMVAQENNLLVTCGSDFHGKTKPSIELCAHRADEHMSEIVTMLHNAGVLE